MNLHVDRQVGVTSRDQYGVCAVIAARHRLPRRLRLNVNLPFNHRHSKES